MHTALYHNTNPVHMLVCPFMFYLSSGCLQHHAAKPELQHLVEEEWSRLSSVYQRLKNSVDAVVQHLPEQSRPLYHRAYKVVTRSARRICGRPKASKVLDARDIRRQIEDLHNPELLQQLSSYEEDTLKPFVVTFLDQCRGNGVQPDSSQPDFLLSPSTPAAQVLGFILDRKDYYVTDLHINRECFSPWDVDTPPPAQTPPTPDGPDHHHCQDDLFTSYFAPTLDGLSHQLDGLLTSYAPLFSEVLESVETLSQDQYHKLRSSFRGLPYTRVHLPSSQDEVYSRLHDTPLFAPLCTALLRKVVWLLFTRDADNLSRKLEDYEKKLVTFVSQFLLACRRGCVVPPTRDVSLNESDCDLSDPTHLLAYVLALKPYYVGSLCVDKSLFTQQKEGSLEGEEEREEVRWDSQRCFLVLVYLW